jgi:hypothetical protein
VFVEKLVCGLYYFEYREPFPSFAEIRLARKHHGSADDLSGCLSMTRNGQKRWPNIFEYRHNRVRDLPHESLWMFLFYGYIQWVVFTGDPKRHETEESPS